MLKLKYVLIIEFTYICMLHMYMQAAFYVLSVWIKTSEISWRHNAI